MNGDKIQKKYRFQNEDSKTVEKFINKIRPKLQSKVGIGLKTRACLSVTMTRFSGEGNNERQSFHIRKPNMIIRTHQDFSRFIRSLSEFFNQKIAEMELKGTGWMLESIDEMELIATEFEEETGGCGHFKLPKKIENRKIFGSILSQKNECLKDSLSFLTSSTLIFKDMKFPAGKSDMKVFEKNNPKFLIYCLSYDSSYGIYYKSPNFHELSKTKKILPILFCNGHFLPIKSQHLFFQSMFSRKKPNVCLDCLTSFSNMEKLNHHHTYCQKEYKMKLNYPKPNSVLKFEDYQSLHKHPFFCTLDIEARMENVDVKKGNSTKIIQKHIPTHFGLYFFNELDPTKSEYSVFFNVSDLMNKLHFYKNTYLSIDIPLYGSELEKAIFEEKTATHCYACQHEIMDEFCKDHDHFSGKFRGICCRSCNLKMKKPNFLPVFAHNMMGYDIKHLILEIREELNIMGKNSENFMKVETKGNLKIRFLDSYKFLGHSLRKLVDDLPEDEMHITKSLFLQDFKLFTKKGEFPFQYYDSLEKLKDNQLPPPSAYYDMLKEKHITEEDYRHLKYVWEKRGHQNLGQHLEDYLKSDVSLLADVIQFFRKKMIHIYELDPLYYFTLPHFGLRCALKFSNQILELVSDPTMYNMIERGIRGGFCSLITRKAVANNPYLKNYNAFEAISYIIYLDANNLYGLAMCKELPVGNFKWAKNPEKWRKLGKCIVDADIFIPDHLKSKFKDFPLCPEKKNGKLQADFYPKSHFVCHSDYLKSILRLGYKIKKVNSCITFDSKPWLKSFIEKNTELRTNATSDIEKEFWKLLNNSVYGKQIEDVRSRVDLKVVHVSSVKKAIQKSHFKKMEILVPDQYYLVEFSKKYAYMNKPIYGGLSILDFSKIHMHEFFYNYVKQKFNAKLIYTDTDSFILHIFTEDYYKDILPDLESHFDTSASNVTTLSGEVFPKLNKKVIGKFKDETNGIPIRVSYGLGPKVYYLEKDDEDSILKIKGITRASQRKINRQDFEDIIEGKKQQIWGDNTIIRSRNHVLGTETIHKKVLDGIDTKRQLLEDGIHTLPWGY